MAYLVIAILCGAPIAFWITCAYIAKPRKRERVLTVRCAKTLKSSAVLQAVQAMNGCAGRGAEK